MSDRIDEILETLWSELVENKKDGSNQQAIEEDLVKELLDEGYVYIKDNRIYLTKQGEDEARSCVRRHRLAERLFADILDVKKTSVHEPSCRFEHLLHKGLDDTICTLLGHPKTCPHGRPIPEGTCCKNITRIEKRLLMPLSELETNKKVKIAYLQTHDNKTLQKLIAIGALPKTDLVLVQKFPSYVLKIGKSQFAIDKELASCIYVRLV